MQPGRIDSGWKEVERDKQIQADLDEVGIQIRTRNNLGKVEIKVEDTNNDFHSTIEWSTASTTTFKLSGTCSTGTHLNESPNTQVLMLLLTKFTIEELSNLNAITCFRVMK